MHRPSIALVLIVLTAVVTLVLAVPPPTVASSHREAPAITEDPTVDCTDVYAFRSTDGTNTVTIIANYHPTEEPSGGPNYFKFSDTALYEIHIDNSGDGNEDITYQFDFKTTTKNDTTLLYNTLPMGVGTGNGVDAYSGLNVVQTYTVTRVDGDRRTGNRTTILSDVVVAPNNLGSKSVPGGYAALEAVAVHSLPSEGGGAQVFCGPRDDPFFIQLGRTFDLINIAPVFPGGLPGQQVAPPQRDTLSGFNVHSIVLKIPLDTLTRNGKNPTNAADPDSIIGVWSTSSRRQVKLLRTKGQPAFEGGAWVQVSRLGMPLFNELALTLGTKDRFNNSEPNTDSQWISFAANHQIAGILNFLFDPTTGFQPQATYTSVPTSNRNDLVNTFFNGLTAAQTQKSGQAAEYLRINLAVPPVGFGAEDPLGLLAAQADGFPNGRRLPDDVVDIELRVVGGALIGFAADNTNLGDTTNTNDVAFTNTFPFIAPPHAGDLRVHGED